ncbi:18S rRNA (guanine1575-N7)-methyltransferase [Microbotryomycetes sp. JL201]|nr:18S rRNA (guanine1575-N7)-methyltransferase [Microbotryomycetes sp. JL201]
MSGNRPEHIAPPQVFYNQAEAKKYSNNTRIQTVQADMTYRCLELLSLPRSLDDEDEPQPAFLLDVGAGSGLSGEILTEEGHEWVGMDVSGGMLEVALDREVEGDLMLADIGQGVPFRAGAFDGAISVSVLQWLCNADSTSHSPAQRLSRFFTDLFGCLAKGARAVFQFYPESDEQVKFIMEFATKAGFGGGLVVDYPNSTKKYIRSIRMLRSSAHTELLHRKKFYLVLYSGQPDPSQMPRPLGVEGSEEMDSDRVAFEKRRDRAKSSGGRRNSKKRQNVKDIDWILKKKERYRQKGKADVPRDSKYTARPRKNRF